MKFAFQLSQSLPKLTQSLTKAYLGLPFFQRKPRPTQCQTCGLQKDCQGNFVASYKSTKLSPNEAYTKVCRFPLAKGKPCINTETTLEIVKSLDWSIGPNGQQIDTSIEPYLQQAEQVTNHAWAVYKLNKCWKASPYKKPLDLRLETYLFWLTSGFLFVTILLLLIRELVWANLINLGLL